MRPPIGAGQWSAIRALCEGRPPTYRLVAAATGLPVQLITARAYREGWPKVDCRRAAVKAAHRTEPAAPDAPADDGGDEPAESASGPADPATHPQERVRRVMDALLREVERIGAATGRGGRPLDKARIDGVWAMIRTLERAERFFPRGPLPAEAVEEDPAERSRKAAEVLAKIDDRISELAYAFAKEMVEDGWDGARSGGVSGAAVAGAPGGAQA